MNIGFVYNVRHVKPDLQNPDYIKQAEFDEPSTISGIYDALRELGHEIYCIEADENAYTKLKSHKDKLDLVFNIAEGLHGRDREAHLPAILEMLQIPYTGPSPLGYALGLDKALAKEVMITNGIATPDFVLIEDINQLKEEMVPFLPAIVKPVGEGSSKGITAKNLVFEFEELKEVAEEIINEHKQAVLVEKYLRGREFTVGVLGTPARTLPIIEITFNGLPENMPKFDHYEAKWIFDNPEKGTDPLICPAKLSISLRQEIISITLNAFKALHMADWARFDLRLDENKKPSILEVNCPPGLIPNPEENSRFPRAALSAGLEFKDVIEEILKSACMRYGIHYQGKRKKNYFIFKKNAKRQTITTS
ncbi:MAG: D-alanine--D-alanine ligase [Patescibacteria group bacterium]|nr:D-alanine--D-alanine ligase [Patescibacteria group bacterium]